MQSTACHEYSVVQYCPWTGSKCTCTTFPWTVDNLIPRRCEMGISLDLIPLRKVRQPLKALYEIYKAELENGTYDYTDPKWAVR